MVKVVGVRFKRAGKVYYFDPGEFELAKGDKVVVETARGIEFGETVGPAKEVTEEELTTPLKKVIRPATPADEAQLKENEAREKEAFGVAGRKIAEHNLEMDLVDVEYTFDGNKIIFYFTAEGRVDFRELVRDLAAVFRTRIELRQIGVRDEAKMLGGIGPCGRALCCTTFLGDFAPVSIKMAKEQNLSLNPTKISGLCGRLLCCLRYESEHYERAKATYPPVGTPVSTKDGDGRVAAINVIKGVVSVEFPTGVAHEYPVDGVRSAGKPSVSQPSISQPDAAQPSSDQHSEVSTDAAPAGDVPAEPGEVAAAPCASCAGGGSCPRVEAEEAVLEEEAVLVAEGVASEGEPPVVIVFEPVETETEPGTTGPVSPVGPASPAPIASQTEAQQHSGPHPRPDSTRGNHRRGNRRSRHGGDRPRNGDNAPHPPVGMPQPRPRNEEKDNGGGGEHRPE